MGVFDIVYKARMMLLSGADNHPIPNAPHRGVGKRVTCCSNLAAKVPVNDNQVHPSTDATRRVCQLNVLSKE